MVNCISDVVSATEQIQNLIKSGNNNAHGGPTKAVGQNAVLARAFSDLTATLSNLDDVAATSAELQPLLNVLIDCLESKNQYSDDFIGNFVLRTLGALLYERAPLLATASLLKLVGPTGLLIVFCNDHRPNYRRRQLSAVQCVRNICLRVSAVYKSLLPKGTKVLLHQEVMGACATLLVSVLQDLQFTNERETTDSLKVALCSLVGLQSLLENGFKVEVAQLGRLLGALKAFLGCGLPGFTFHLPCVLHPLVTGDACETRNGAIGGTNGIPLNPLHKSVVKRRKPKPLKRERDKLKKAALLKQQANGSPAVAANGDGDEADSNSELSQSFTSSDTDSFEIALAELDLNGDEPNEHSSRVQSTVGSISPVKVYRKKANGICKDQTESEDSDYATGGSKANVQSLKGSVRAAAIAALAHVANKAAQKKYLFGFWLNFAGDPCGLQQQPPSLSGKIASYDVLSVILKEANAKTRASAVVALSSWISACRQFLMLAEKSPKRSSFTSLSGLLANSLSDVFRALLLALSAETTPSVVIQLLKCLANLCCNSNLAKITDSALLLKIVSSVRPYLTYKDPTVRVACLTCFCVLVTSKVSDADISQILQSCGSQDGDSIPANGSSAASMIGIGLLDLCCQIICDAANNSIPVRLEAMQIISGVVKTHFGVVRKVALKLVHFAVDILRDPDVGVKLHGVRIINEFLGVTDAKKTSPDLTEEIGFSQMDIWRLILSCPQFCSCFQITKSFDLQLAAVAVDTIGYLTAENFSSLSEAQQQQCKMLLSYAFAERDPLVRSSALKSFGHICSFAEINKDYKFILAGFEMVKSALRSNNSGVMERFCICMALCAEALLVPRSMPLCLDQDQQDDWQCIQLQLTRIALTGCATNAKFRPGCILALGKFLQLLNYENADANACSKMVGDAIKWIAETLRTSTNKGKFNACAAAGFAFSNSSLISTFHEHLTSLISVVIGECNNENVTVRSLAVEALGQLCAKPSDETIFREVLKTLLQSMDITSIENLSYQSYRSRDNLIASSFQSFVKLVRFANAKDLEALFSCVKEHLKAFAFCCDRYKTNVFSRTNSPTLTASEDTEGALSAARPVASPLIPPAEEILAAKSEGEYFACLKHLRSISSAAAELPSEKGNPESDLRLCIDTLLSIMSEGLQ